MNKAGEKMSVYICIDLKSFYASVECVERGLDPLKTNLVVADESRTEKTICLAVSPPLKAYGIAGRARLFEVVQKVREVNQTRRRYTPGKMFSGKSVFDEELKQNPQLAVDYVIAPPRMAYYIEYSVKIYEIYLKYISAEDIHVYSIDEVFIDATNYLKTYRKTARELALMIIRDVYKITGITATAGVGENMYLAKVAMDIVAKKMPADKDGARIAELDERSYRKLLWEHEPITDFWRIGGGYAKKLAENGMFTMGDVARCSLSNQALLYKLFGVNAELLIDHAWGYEPCKIEDIKRYRPSANSISSGQVLTEPYPYEKARLIVKEMSDALALDLLGKGLVTRQLTLTVGYDKENCGGDYSGEFSVDRYGRAVPAHSHGTVNLERETSSSRLISSAVVGLFERISDRKMSVRRITICACGVVFEQKNREDFEQLSLFTDYEKIEREAEALEREKSVQKAVIAVKERFGKNAVFRGMSLEEGATARSRNAQIGGHRA